MLVVTSVPPLPEGGAAGRCVLGLLHGLHAHGIHAHVIHPGDTRHRADGHRPDGPNRADDALAAALPSGLSVEAITLPNRGLWAIRRERVVKPLGALARHPFSTHVAERGSEADVVHFVEAEAAGAIDAVEGPAVLQLHCLTREDPRTWNPLRAAGRVSIELLRGEGRARKRARWLLANSPEVADALAAATPGAHVAVAPLALDPAHYSPPATLAAPVAGLIGTAHWPSTAEAVQRLLGSVWPLVLARRPDARLVLAGDGMEAAAFRGLPQYESVQWRGRVPSAADFLRELGVLLYPLTSGTGAKVKVLEALALGVPVVTTPRGAEGIMGRGGITVESDDHKLAQATAALLADHDARRAAGAAALTTFTEHHSPAPAAAPVVELYRRMLA